jgi:hypothetical protein
MEIITSFMNALRKLPQGSAIDIPWGWMEQHELTKDSVIFPSIDLNSENKITQTAARLFFAVILPQLAKPFGYANLSLGATHLVWCVLNIKRIRNKEEGCSPQDIESALVRIFTGAYDLGIAYILYSSLLNTIHAKTILLLAVALVPAYPIQLHHLIFEKATKKIEGAEKIEVDHRVLKVGCLIKQFCAGLVETFTPAPPEVTITLGARAWALPSALGTWGRSSYVSIRGLPIEDDKPK